MKGRGIKGGLSTARTEKPSSENGWQGGDSGTLRVRHGALEIESESRVALYDVTDRIKGLVRTSGVRSGLLTVSTLHTTTALFVNEFQAALLEDIEHFLERLASRDAGYLHNCEDCSDCERKNAEAHLRALVLSHQIVLPVRDEEVLLGQWQSIVFAELDGPRPRRLAAQILDV